jgi:putative heme transporter
MTDHALPALDVGALVRRTVVLAAVVVAAAMVVMLLAGGPLRAFADAFGRALAADPRWVVAAALFELLSFGGYVVLLWLVGAKATPRLGLRASAHVTLGAAAATRLLPTAGVGGAALTLWALRRAGLDAREATRTLLGFLVVLYSVFLGAIMGAGALLALGLAPGDGPLALSALPAAGAALVLAAGLVLAVRRPPAAAAQRVCARALFRGPAGVLGAAVRDALALMRSGDPRLLGALAWWAFDAAVLWAMLRAFGAPPSLAVLVLAYFVGQVGNTIPIPGAVSGGIVGVLLAFGVQADLALVSVLAYRAVAIWLPAPIGVAALGGLRRTVARWSREDALLPQAPPAGTSGNRCCVA